jgi:hypothetical protein
MTDTSSRPRWTLLQQDVEYRDYILYLPDSNEHGGRMVLTLNPETRTAYIQFYLDNRNGDSYGAPYADSVSFEWACHVAKGVDGWTPPRVEG